jgi:hypothetical protein
MAFTDDFLELMPDIVGIEAYGGEDEFGDPLPYGPLTLFQCRIVGKGLSVRRQASEDDTVIYDIYLDVREDPFRTFTTKDRITLPPDQGFLDLTPEIFTVGRFPDEDNEPHHIKLQCGWMYHRQGQ